MSYAVYNLFYGINVFLIALTVIFHVICYIFSLKYDKLKQQIQEVKAHNYIKKRSCEQQEVINRENLTLIKKQIEEDVKDKNE